MAKIGKRITVSAALAALVCATPLAVTHAETAAVAASGRLNLQVAAQSGAAVELLVEGAAGRYDRLGTTKFTLPLSLSAEPGADASGYRIIKSEVFLDAAGSATATNGVSTLTTSAPVKSISGRQDLGFDAAGQAAVSQNAIAACNQATGGARTASIEVPVLWRVTTGRLNFKWTNYDRVAPTDDVVNNPDVYGDRDISEATTRVTATVLCQPLPAAATASVAPVKAQPLVPVKTELVDAAVDQPAVVAAAPVAAPATAHVPVTQDVASDTPMKLDVVKKVTLTSEPIEAKAAPVAVSRAAPSTEPAITETVKTQATPAVAPTVAKAAVTKPAAATAPIYSASLPSKDRPACEGGMVRQIISDQSYLCLCPGNTKRVSTGDNAYACRAAKDRR